LPWAKVTAEDAMTDDAIVSLRARDRRAWRRLAKRIGVLPGKRIVSTHLLLDALFDPEITRSAAELLALAHGTARGQPRGKRECFVCYRPPTPTMAPAGVIVVQVLGTEEALLSLACQHCFTGDADKALLAALRRDLR
jgi:hypothetical protein